MFKFLHILELLYYELNGPKLEVTKLKFSTWHYFIISIIHPHTNDILMQSNIL